MDISNLVGTFLGSLVAAVTFSLFLWKKHG